MPALQESLEVLSINETTSFSLNSQSAHRLSLFQSWLKIAQENGYDLESNIVGKQTLDIGCGQGDMIALFATVLKAQGNKESKVIGVDPASLDYGEFVYPHSIQIAQPLNRRTLDSRRRPF
jgi:2-polyprenyl-3-methyl-5-hydroxy-6-metoxy-1,4-benzoquinol methylase